MTLTEIQRRIAVAAPVTPPLLAILRSLGEGRPSFDRLTAMLEYMPALADRVLALSNSAYYSPRQPIEDLRQAAVIVGERTLVGLTVGVELDDYFGSPHARYAHAEHGLLQHSLAVATVGWSIAESLGAPADVCGRIYVAGLFHDIGKVFVAEYAAAKGRLIDLPATPDEPPGLAKLERDAIGISHDEVGGILASQWGLPDDVRTLIEQHHTAGSGETDASVLHYADHLLAGLAVGMKRGVPITTPLDGAALRAFEGRPEFLSECEARALRESARAITTVEAIL